MSAVVINMIPTASNPMSETTALVLQLAAIAVMIGGGAMLWWIRREVARLDGRIDCHETFVDDTTDTLTTIKVDIAGIKSDMGALKHMLSDMAESNRDVIKYMLQHAESK